MSQKKKSRREEVLTAVSRDLQRRKRERIAILILGLLVAAAIYFTFRFSEVADKSTMLQPIVRHLFIFGVWTLLLVLIMVLVFLIIRNVAKFMMERRRGVLGSRLRMRLIMSFMMLTLGPAAALFTLSLFILNTSIEHLYEPHVMTIVDTSKGAIENANQISKLTSLVLADKYDADGKNALHFAQELSRALMERGFSDVLERESAAPAPGDTAAAPADGATAEAAKLAADLGNLRNFIDFKRREYGLAKVSVFERKGRKVMVSVDEDKALPDFPDEDVMRALEGEQGFNPPISVDDHTAILHAFYPVPRRLSGEQTEIAGVITVGKLVSWIPREEWSKLEVAAEAKATIEDYETMKAMERPIKFSYFLLLLFVTLIVIFLSVWFGFYLAKGLTEPIQLLAEGTEMVASGNLDYRIDLKDLGDDEISTVVMSFNKMTEDIQKSRTELDQAYKSLRDSNLEVEARRKYMETVLNHIGAGVLTLDPENRLSTVNPAAKRMLRRDEQALKPGAALTDVLSPEEREVIGAMFEELEKGGSATVIRQVTIVREKRSYVLLLMVSRLTDDAGKPLGTVIMIEDLTELIRAHRAMAWREVARRIAHEIKNPLTPIKLSAQRIERRFADKLSGEEEEIFSEAIRTIVHQVDELKRLVNEFSLFARLPSTNPVPSKLSEIIDDVMPLYREAHTGVGFKVNQDPRLPLLELDKDQMKRVFINLLDNAVAGMNGAGEVEVETAFNEQLQIVRIEVRDNGPGIPEHVKERMFEPYYSTKPDGSGLGLTIVQRIVSDHYGYIRVMDNEPRGTKFVIELPVILAERQISPRDHARTM